jgi:hypothetical protein
VLASLTGTVDPVLTSAVVGLVIWRWRV